MIKSQDLKKYHLPDGPGVYIFKQNKDILYVGKATSIRDRARSYFSRDLISTRGPLLVDLLFKANKITYMKTDSVLEAIILEANLIKKYQPKYNTKEKDNKSFNFVIITAEDFPRILIVRGREIEKGLPYAIRTKFGPYTSAEVLKKILKIIRKIFPFRDRCLPLFGRPCFNRQLHLCPGICDGSISKKDYQKIVKKIELILSGKINHLKKNLNKDMKSFASTGEYEKAGEIKRQIFALNHIQDVVLIMEPTTLDKTKKEGFRIEAYDVAHLSGTNNVGVMVVMEDGVLKKSDYRKFKIRNSKGDDIGALKEILERRLRHSEWPSPDLIVVDGGMAQLNASTAPNPSLSNEGERKKVAVVAVTKDDRHKPKAIIGDETLIKKFKKEILAINHEAHRFALAFHRQKRRVIL